MKGLTGLWGLTDDGTLYDSYGKKIVRLPLFLSSIIHKFQHFIAKLTWR
jgi:hypothetical protein